MSQQDETDMNDSLDGPTEEESVPGTPDRSSPGQNRHSSNDDGVRSPVVPSTPEDVAPSTPSTPGDRDSSTLLPQQPPSTPEDAVPPTPHRPSTPPLTPLSDLEEGGEEGPANPNNDNAPENPPEAMEEPLFAGGQQTLIRGTDVHVPTVAAAFTEFLQNFRSLPKDDEDSDSDLEEEEEELPPPLYLSRLQKLLDHGAIEAQDGTSNLVTKSLDIDTMHLYFHNEACQRFYHQLVKYPMELVPLMDILVQRQLQRMAPDQERIPTVQVRPYNLREVSNLRCLDPASLDALLSVQGMVVRTSPVIPDLKVAHFSCVICGNAVQVTIDRGRIAEPHRCGNCQTKDSFRLLHSRSWFHDKQLVRLQETPDRVPAGQTPASVSLFCFDSLVDAVQPGDRVEVTGVLRAQPRRVSAKLTKLKSVYRTYLDVIHFRRITGMQEKKEATQAGGMKLQLSPERIQELRRLSRQPDIYQQLTASLAPSIWELDNVKKGVLCMLFGGNHVRVKKQQARTNRQDDDDRQWSDEEVPDQEDDDEATKLNKRGDINILLCGDPGTSKSQLLSYVHKLSARGVYTSGKGSSAVGLTASVVRDPETRDLVLESGALVLSDQGICCIDEFDKMSDTTRSVLHEAMEQQTVSIAKAGIIASLNARTSILASANPTESRYNPSLSVVENIQLPPTLLSRFDLIYLILDSPNAEQDRRLAQHLVGLYYDTPNVVKPPLDQDLLRDYIEYARNHIHPELSDEATQELLNSYLEMRNGGNLASSGTRTISATPRQLESLIRLSEALAKMRYSEVVTRADVREAVRLMKVATQTAATDPRTGRIDMDMITTGRSTADREMEENLLMNLKELFAERRGSRMAVRDVTHQLTEVTNNAVSQDEVVVALRKLEADGVIQFHERAQTVFVRVGIIN